MNTNYKNLKVWEKSINLVNEIYRLTSSFPKEELYWIVSQIRRSAVSVSSNIAEWAWRNWNNEFKQFLHIAKWSCFELQTQIIISLNLGFIWNEEFNSLDSELTEIIRMIQWLIKALNSKA